MNNTFSIKTLGCKLNQYESSLIASQFFKNGWTSKPFGECVDLVIVNTCTVTNKSDKKCRNYIRQGADFSRTGKVLVTGCLAEREADYLNKMPQVFAVVRNSDKEKIFNIIKNYREILFSDAKEFNNLNNTDALNKQVKTNESPLPFYRTRGLIKIQDGCDGECSYCIVPSVRGKPVSRDLEDIASHAKRLVGSGCPELILTGITIGKYHSDNRTLADLIKKITDIKGDFRIRITSIEPNHVSKDLIDLFTDNKVCSHIHIPLQSGSDRILKLMRRPYSIKDYLGTVDKIRKIDNDIAIGTDLIIGFPEESEEDFLLSLKMIEKVGFSYVHQFTFSSREGTPASRLQNCSFREISERSAGMRTLSALTGLKYRRKFLGKDLLSVIEKNKNKNGYRAVSSNYVKMNIKNSSLAAEKAGKITRVRLHSAEIEENIGVL